MSKNLVELVRRHHALDAPTALGVLKEAVELRGEVTDADRRLAAERSGLPEAAVHGGLPQTLRQPAFARTGGLHATGLFTAGGELLLAGVPLLIGVGAPSSLAIELATDRGMTLCGFARGDGQVNVYAGLERVA